MKMHLIKSGRQVVFCPILCLLLILPILLCACKNDKYYIPSELENEQAAIKEGVVLLTDKKEYSQDVEKIFYSITNYSDEIYIYTNEVFEFQYYSEKGWVKCPFNDKYVHTYLYWNHEVKKGESTSEEEIIMKYHFDLPMKKGYYRIVRDDLISNIFFIG
ncbi:MAG: hypothetical protein J6A78_01410 [Clostridia bacterium]|nr:hypothetical protein [Clostridia bacterium]